MKFLIIFLFFLCNISLAEDKSCEQLRTEGFTQEQLSKRGCCSHHQGVCNCTSGRVVCCDGQLSPSCNCHRDDINQFKNQNESEKVHS